MPIHQDKQIDTPTLKFLVQAGKAGELVAIGTADGFRLAMREPDQVVLLQTQRGEIRVFSRLDSVAKFVSELGVHQLVVDLSGWGG